MTHPRTISPATLLAALALTLSGATASAQTTFEEMKADPATFGGVYYPYPEAQVAPAQTPKGYEPFYVSHFSRHGSRYMIGDRDLEWVVELFNEADSAGALTPKGKEVHKILTDFHKEMAGRGGELTPLGERQHRGIANRMMQNYPNVFDKGARVTAVSTPVMRCAYSMMAFTEALKEKNPSLTIPRESSHRNMRYLNYHSPESSKYTAHNGPTRIGFAKYKEERTNPERLMASLFSDPAFVWERVDPDGLMWGLYWVAVDLPNTEQGTTLFPYFTEQELFDLWKVFNYEFYIHNAGYPKAQGMHLDNASNLINNIVDTADEYVEAGDHGATLRFAHDGNIVPLVAKMRVEGTDGMAVEPDSVHTVWASWKVAPMASNLQLIFFRNKKNADDILVEVLFNERPVRLEGIETDRWPYYRWSALRPHLKALASESAARYIP